MAPDDSMAPNGPKSQWLPRHDFLLFQPTSAHLAKGTSLAQGIRFLIGKTRVQNIARFGYAIEHLCRGLPTYYASQEQGWEVF